MACSPTTSNASSTGLGLDPSTSYSRFGGRAKKKTVLFSPKLRVPFRHMLIVGGA
ncbi:hypothetical protein AURDEDRAFT_112034 [Auricularia subglabra TFB-10046 SS5]|nr:hypothetical protein AURDEDRAFT_112034 [Auricularia subglabra TFB-10046 SS5]